MQPGIVIDSGAWGYLVYPTHPKHSVVKEQAQKAINCLPTAVIGELYYGAFNQPERIEIRVREIDNRLRPFKIIRPDKEICRIWGKLADKRNKEFAKSKVVKDYTDMWIAATALRHGFPVLTTNKKDFEWIEDLIVIEV